LHSDKMTLSEEVSIIMEYLRDNDVITL